MIADEHFGFKIGRIQVRKYYSLGLHVHLSDSTNSGLWESNPLVT